MVDFFFLVIVLIFNQLSQITQNLSQAWQILPL